MIGYPGNGEYPKPYVMVEITTQERGKDKPKLKGEGYWTGYRWMGVRGFRIGLYKVVKWESKND